MASYVEGDNEMSVVVSDTTGEVETTMLKPILFTRYSAKTTYSIIITYEDSTNKTVEMITNDPERPYKITYKKEGQLITVTGIPNITPINKSSRFTDFTNQVMNSQDLLFEMDCSDKYRSIKARFYLKDIRDIIDIVAEGIEEEEQKDILSKYSIKLNTHTCEDTINCIVDDELKCALQSSISKLDEKLTEDEYSDFQIISLAMNNIEIEPVTYTVSGEEKINLQFTENNLDNEFKIIIRYFVKEINHPVFDEFILKGTKPQAIDVSMDEATGDHRAVSTQDPQYLGDGNESALGTGLTPGFKPYQYKE